MTDVPRASRRVRKRFDFGSHTAALLGDADTPLRNHPRYQMLSMEEGAALEGRCNKVNSPGASVSVLVQ